MRMTFSRLGIAACLLAAGQLLWAQATAPAPAINIPVEALSGGNLDAGQVKQIDAYIQYYSNQMLQAKEDARVVEARDKLIEGYGRYDSTTYRSSYTQSASKGLLGVLDAKDQLKNLRQANACLAIIHMAQPAIRPALEKMAVSPDQVVRYYAWQGFRDMRAMFLAQGKDSAQKMFALLAQQMPKENSPAVLDLMMETMNLSTADLAAVSPDVVQLAQDQSYTIMTANWGTLLKSVAAGNVTMISACRDGASTLNYLASVLSKDKGRNAAVLQGLIDLMWNAAVSYDETLQALEKAEGKTKEELDARQGALVDLLVSGENFLKGISGKTIAPVQTAVTDPKTKERGASVKLGILDWVKEFSSAGVTQPKTAETAPASSPATKP